MSTEKLFLKPRFVGHRFDDHSLPINVLEDLSVLEELIFDLARKIYIEENPKRKRVPNHFTDNVYLKLSDIEEGSAIPKVFIALMTSLVTPAISTPNNEYFKYFEKARDKVFEAVELVNQGKSSGLTPKFLSYFNRIGKNLKEGETIDFLNDSNPSRNVVFDRNTRKKILLSINENLQYSDEINEIVLIPSVHRKNNTFDVEIDGDLITVKLEKDFEEVIIGAFQSYNNRGYVSLKGIGVFNEKDKLVHVDKVSSIDVLDPFDVSARLKELSKLSDKWYDGVEGKALNNTSLTEFQDFFENSYDINLPLPAIFPTISGDLLLEWKNEDLSISLEVSLSSFKATLFYYNMVNDDDDDELELNLKDEAGWKTINEITRKIYNE